MAERPVSDAIALALLGAGAGDTLLVAPGTMRDLVRENAFQTNPTCWGGHDVIVVEHWQFGWLVQAAVTVAAGEAA